MPLLLGSIFFVFGTASSNSIPSSGDDFGGFEPSDGGDGVVVRELLRPVELDVISPPVAHPLSTLADDILMFVHGERKWPWLFAEKSGDLGEHESDMSTMAAAQSSRIGSSSS